MSRFNILEKVITLFSVVLMVYSIFVIGGGMAFTFLKAQGFEVGDSLLEVDRIDEVKQLIKTAQEKNVEIVLRTY